MPSVFNIAHWLRDNRLTIKTNSVLISPSPCDSYQGSQPILADTGNYEVIIVGAGISRCSAAYYITRQRPGTKIVILDGQARPGGNANRDDAAPIPLRFRATKIRCERTWAGSSPVVILNSISTY